MKFRKILCFLLLCGIGINTPALATKKKNSKTYIKLIESYTQKTIPGRPGGPPPATGTHFIIIWEGVKYPETFFWRGDGGWLSCQVMKAHKVTGAAGNIQRGPDYRLEIVAGDNIHKGDTVELSPVTGGKFPIPADIPAEAKNTLFFKTGGSGWLSFPVKTINKKAAISMP